MFIELATAKRCNFENLLSSDKLPSFVVCWFTVANVCDELCVCVTWFYCGIALRCNINVWCSFCLCAWNMITNNGWRVKQLLLVCVCVHIIEAMKSSCRSKACVCVCVCAVY